MYTTFVPGAHGGQKRVRGPLELEPPCMCRESNLGSPQEHALLTTEPPAQNVAKFGDWSFKEVKKLK